MLKKLTNEHCLFIVNDDVLAQFKQIAASFEDQLSDALLEDLSMINTYVTVYNVWIALQPYSPEFTFDLEKPFTYLCAFYQIDQLANVDQVQNYITQSKDDPGRIYLFSFFVSMGLVQWTKNIVEQAGEIELIEDYEDEELFSITELDIEKESFNQVLMDEKLLIQFMTDDIRNKPHFERLINNAIQQATDFYFYTNN